MTILSVQIELAAIRDIPGAGGKDEILRIVGDIGQECYGVDAEAVRKGLADREALGSTGFGRGIAIPHTKTTDLDRCAGIFLRLAEPVAFDSHDGKPVDLVYALLSPEKAGIDHLQALAAVSRFLRDDQIIEKLRGAAGRDALYALLNKHREQRAA
jgi:PTS system nitrogen regulatory IIA component